MFIDKINGVTSKLNFKSLQHVNNNLGEMVLRFNYPFDSDNETCEVQIFRAVPTEKYNYKISERPLITKLLDKDGTIINLQRESNLGKDETFAYKIVRRDKHTGNLIWEGPDTGVKIRQEKGEYVFRVHQDAKWKSKKFQVLNKDGSVKLDDKGQPVTIQGGYHSTVEFAGPSDYKYTLVKQNGTTPVTNGAGYLAMPDTYKPGMKYRGFDEDNTGSVYYDEQYQKKMEGVVKTFSNMYGGSMAGLESLIPYLKQNGFKMLFTTPIANGDDKTSHAYWNKNNFQIATNMGTTENYDSLMANEFKNGISHVFDSTLSSEGIEGVHVQHAMRWGEASQAYYWFRMDRLKDEPLAFGVIPDNKENLSHRIINSPFVFELQPNGQYKNIKNEKYNSNKETLIQIYDKSLVTQEQLSKLDEPIRIYEDLKSGKDLRINTHDDTLISYVCEINPNEYAERIEFINDLIKSGKKIDLYSPDGTLSAAQFSNFRFDKVTEGGYTAWDANPDMVKMNYGISPYDEKILMGISDDSLRALERERRKIGAAEVQDMAVQQGIYWANKTKIAHTLYTAQTLGTAKTVESINRLIDEGLLPEEVRMTDERLNNILNGRYNFAPKGVLSKEDATIKAMMALPMDALEFGENVQGVLSTSYFSNRATKEEQVGLSRFELMKQNNPHLIAPYQTIYNKTNALYTNQLNKFAQDVLSKVNESSDAKLFDADGNYTEYGEYIIENFGQNIAKYALLKSLAGNILKTKIDVNGQLTYNYDKIRNVTTLKQLGIHANNPKQEAELLYKKIQNGLNKLSGDDINTVANYVSQKIKGQDLYSFRISEAMMDMAGLGLNFRLDAAKDLADIDSIRNRSSDFNDTWTSLISFWGKYVQGVKSVNPHSYIVAEMTDVADVIRDTYGGSQSCPYNGYTNIINARYNGEPDAMTKFFNETGITSEAAYAYFFTELLTSFSRGFETGKNYCDTHDGFKHKYDLLINTRSVDYLRNLYTFMGNHDKTRTVHGLGVDMELFHSTLLYNGNDFNNNRAQRYDVIKTLSGAKNDEDIPLELKLNIDNLDYFRTVSTRAIAQSKILMSSVDEDLDGIASEEDKKLIREALIDLANGNYMNSKETEQMTKIRLKELSSIENAVNEVARLARQSGANISEEDIQVIIDKAKKLDFKNYAVHGDFDTTEPKEFGDNNKKLLNEILGTDTNAMDYSPYTLQIAKMIKDASKDATKSEDINVALKEFVKLYNRAKISDNMDGMKMFEKTSVARKKNGYAARDFRIAMEEAINQAEFKSGKKIANKEDIINTVYKSVAEPAVTKYAMIMSFLGAFCGIPTAYSGDELGDTGYEDKTKNIWVQNRMPSMWSEVEDKNSKIGIIKRRFMNKMLDTTRNKATVKPLRDGTPYVMDVKIGNRTRDEIKARIAEIDTVRNPHKNNGIALDSTVNNSLKDEKKALQNELAKVAFLMQSSDGDAAISVFNAGGIEHKNRVNYFEKYNIQDKQKRIDFFKKNHIDTLNIDNPYIPIQEKTEIDALLLGTGIALPIGTIFLNADARDKAKYIVQKVGDKLGVVRQDGQKIILDGLTAKNGVMVLRKALSFRGTSHSNNVHNIQYNVVSDAYSNKKQADIGNKLSLLLK